MAVIEEIFFLPPMAVARLGGSDTPLASFTWVEDPSRHGGGYTMIEPATTLQVQQDGSVRASIPATIQFRDGDLLRPVAPFFELWAKVKGSGDPVRLTGTLLGASKGSLANVTYTVTAANRKAARRTGDDSCAFTAQVSVKGDDRDRKPLLASSEGRQGLVPASSPIRLGQFQVIQPVVGQALEVDFDQLRVRFTPAAGETYGPPDNKKHRDPNSGRSYFTVPNASNRKLNNKSVWLKYSQSSGDVDQSTPADTYDGAAPRNGVSLGVVDDTCDAVIQVEIKAGGSTFQASARVFSGPPDFAPDRRPFLSLADDLIDRDPPAAQPAEDMLDQLKRVGDLFQRAYETASLANVDGMREYNLNGQQPGTPPNSPRTDNRSMTPADAPYYRDHDPVPPSLPRAKVPFHDLAVEKHEPRADTDDLALFLRDNGAYVRQLIRPPYGAIGELSSVAPNVPPKDATRRDPRTDRDTLHDMRMPPYMLDSDATPLSLTRRQYDLLMDLVKKLENSRDQPLPTVTNAHVAKVLKRRKKAKANP